MRNKHTENSNNTESSASDSKRKLLKGAAAAPLLMTVASRPVLARGICTPSAWVSGNLSDHHQERECGGRSPGFWKTREKAWPKHRYNPGTCKTESSEDAKKTSWSTASWTKYGGGMCCKDYNNDGTKFQDVFGGGKFGDRSLMQVLWLEGNEDPYKLGAHLVAALLNAATIADYGMTERDVIDLYKYNRFGMTSAEMVDFIQQTFSDIY